MYSDKLSLKSLFPILFCLLTGHFVLAQTNISGVINIYTKLSGKTGDTLTVGSTAGFSIGDKILIMQMQGATINQNNTSQFGSVSSLNNAGNYEYTTVCAINNNQLIVTGVTRDYSIGGRTQVIQVPVFANAFISSPLSPLPWNGSTGGVLAFECTGTLAFNSDIIAFGTGFRGGEVTTSSYSCAWFANVSDYYYNINSGEGAKKGEGIARYINGKTGGKGPQANGGGGSNDHNGGGGGGSNASSGGLGGQRIPPSTFSCSCTNPGLAGTSLAYSNAANRVYLGGGGGAGHENNVGTGTAGSAGGGIVMIKANMIIANGNSIIANGDDVIGSSADGAGGGGAGGTVLLDAGGYLGTLTVDVSGADGGDVANVGNNCNGPGGGGSGGVVWVSQSSIPAQLSIVNAGGLPGSTTSTTQTNCNVGNNNSATSGSSGNSLTNLVLQETDCNESIPASSVNDTICAEDSIFLEGAWQTTSGSYTDTLTSGCCQSIVETNLTVLAKKESSFVDTICDGDSLVINGKAYSETTSNAQEVFSSIGEHGCDSTVSFDLTVIEIDTSISKNNPTLKANDSIGTTFQWFICPEFTPISDETGNSFTATDSGEYAVVITKNGCSDTSSCHNLVILGTDRPQIKNEIGLFPNPTDGIVHLTSQGAPMAQITVFDASGRIINRINAKGKSQIEVNLSEKRGIYLLTVQSEKQITNFRVIKL